MEMKKRIHPESHCRTQPLFLSPPFLPFHIHKYRVCILIIMVEVVLVCIVTSTLFFKCLCSFSDYSFNDHRLFHGTDALWCTWHLFHESELLFNEDFQLLIFGSLEWTPEASDRFPPLSQWAFPLSASPSRGSLTFFNTSICSCVVPGLIAPFQNKTCFFTSVSPTPSWVPDIFCGSIKTQK